MHNIFVNPSPARFASVARAPHYVDKTALIGEINRGLENLTPCICSTRPRRFGKTYAAWMLAAYFSKGADTRELFSEMKIGKDPTFETNLNKFDVIFLDMSCFTPQNGYKHIRDIQKTVCENIRIAFPDDYSYAENALTDLLANIYSKSGKRFYIIIDEWDAFFRIYKSNTELHKEYIEFLRGLFKGLIQDQFLIGAYMTGILPIKKYGTQSALTNFTEYTMLSPGPLAPFIGFTRDEVEEIYSKNGMDADQAAEWYDGYQVFNCDHIYNPCSVIESVRRRQFTNYWSQSETYESLKTYIDLNFDGLREAVASMLGNHPVPVRTDSFLNDVKNFRSRDDVLTLLIHLGYLTYDSRTNCASIPNSEVRDVFVTALRNSSREELVNIINVSDQVLRATLRQDAAEVARLIDAIHAEESTFEFYSNEQALRAVLSLAYLTARDKYQKFQEIAGGRGYIDILFIPRPGQVVPPLLVELKWDNTADSAINQIANKDYPQVLEKFNLTGHLLAVGISYSIVAKSHCCRICEMSVP